MTIGNKGVDDFPYVQRISQVPITHVVKPIVEMIRKFLDIQSIEFTDSHERCSHPELLLLPHTLHVPLILRGGIGDLRGGQIINGVLGFVGSVGGDGSNSVVLELEAIVAGHDRRRRRGRHTINGRMEWEKGKMERHQGKE